MRLGSELPAGEAVAVPRSATVLQRLLAEAWGTRGWDAPEQRPLDGGFCLSGREGFLGRLPLPASLQSTGMGV